MNKITRRQALGATAGALTALGLAGATAHAAVTGSRTAAPATPAGGVDEVYQGRRIRIVPASGGGDDHGGHHGGHQSPGLPTVLIDGRELHVMRNADGSWISVVNHYETFSGPLPLARAAVRELQGAALVPMGGM
ncbi:tyrosinase cofactor [Streptomyces sp. NPDC002812]|uniref:apotyrosinase chaperone MelC1 n=1 Tax=unclassified Streptomyces TaxID=2593676 RepID=UPI00202E32EC|nr:MULTISPECIES: tyrosinase cofactor [unclassified Streptomyces]MCM1965197.1 tyrosinase cofactor [Streptomyces sp. G1]MCX5128212.1 tyrosinase cofactor [Streptomyces sp. NBC_00347]MCX5300894.1 tyrosinase cofactor [Streptomyces sp. NBC_00193]